MHDAHRSNIKTYIVAFIIPVSSAATIIIYDYDYDYIGANTTMYKWHVDYIIII